MSVTENDSSISRDLSLIYYSKRHVEESAVEKFSGFSSPFQLLKHVLETKSIKTHSDRNRLALC